MRIIDKNTDYYDYLQNVYPDDTTVFDRSDSYLLTKKALCEYMYAMKPGKGFPREDADIEQANFVLLQIGCTYWLFLAVLSDITDSYFPGERDISDKKCLFVPLNFTSSLQVQCPF